MKKIKSIILALGFLAAAGCEQEVLEQQPPEVVEEPTPTAGNANFSKYVAIGTSISAGFQAGALFTDGQNESLAAILANQFAGVNNNAAFNQPSINSVNGYNATFSSPPGLILGRMILFDPDGPLFPRSPSPTPSKHPGGSNSCTNVNTPPVPAPYNTADLPTAYTGNKALLNNFSVPGIIAYQLTQTGTGNPANPLYNGLYGRFASSPGTSTILGDALAAAPTFFSFEIGFNEAVGYAAKGATGADLTTAPYDPATFGAVVNGSVATILGTFTSSKGVISNVPDVTKLPHFSLVPWNSIVLPDQATIDATNTAYAAYNGGLDAAFGGGAITAAERDKRKIIFTSGKNGIVIADESLTNLSGLGLPSIRQATAKDKMTLAAGAVLGTRQVCDNPSSVIGVGVPLADNFTLTETEIVEIQTAITGYNTAISNLVTANSSRLVLADLYAAYENWINPETNKGTLIVNGIPVTASITPPLAGFSEDGVHPNGKGTAIFANVFIDAINAHSTWGASINKANVTKYKGTRTPVNGQ